MVVNVERPERLEAAELDAFLHRGWFRIGQVMFTCRAVWFEEAPRSALWLRLPLFELNLRKSQRKRLSRIERRFQIEFGPMRIDDERRALYQRYREHVSGNRAETLEQVLGLGGERDLFETWELRIRDGNDLVAFSWFDLGLETVQSILGVFDPEWGRYSLGFVSMLLEARWAQSQGYHFHYPGYVLPGAPQMDYKLRVPGLEVWHPDTLAWLPIDQRHAVPHLVENSVQRLQLAADALSSVGIRTGLHAYEAFDLPAFHRNLPEALDVPILLHVYSAMDPARPRLLVWRPQQTYELLEVQPMALIARNAQGEEVSNGRRRFFRVDRVRTQTPDLRELVSEIQRSVRR